MNSEKLINSFEMKIRVNYLVIYWVILLFHKGSIVFMKKRSRFSCQDTQNGMKRPEKWLRKNVRMDVCACSVDRIET